jgi:DNA repair exonuclease SbcCD ATPase subunit
MKICAISLKDVRRFTGAVRIDGIGDGVNVLSAPNESGKSTVFGALRALFFLPHGSRGKEIALLRPHAGGAPEVSAEIETRDGRFQISKRWFSKPEARVTRNGVLIAQADQAEHWIAQLLGGGDGGPSGLLWVRQGLTSLADGNNREQQAALDARRDLLSSVTGEVEAITGGRRMDAALARCREELGCYATTTGRPKSGGTWALAEQAVETLTAERDDLAKRVTALQNALIDRSRMRRDLAEIEAPVVEAQRKARVDAAVTAHAEAKAHAERVNAAAQELQMAALASDRALRDLAELQGAIKDHASAVAKDAEAKSQLQQADEAFAGAEQAFAAAAAAHDAAEAARQRADDLLRRAQNRAAALAARDRRNELADRIAKASVARQAVETAKAEASVGPDDAAMDRLRSLSAALSTARALRDTTATRITVRYAPGREGSIRSGDSALVHDGVLPIYADTVLHIGELGSLTVHPGEGPEGLADVAGAEADFGQALGELGLASSDAADRAYRKRKAAAESLSQARAELAALAPKGIDDLQRQLAALPEPDADDADLPSIEVATAALHNAKSKAVECAATRDALRERRDDARTAKAEAVVWQASAAERLQAARLTLERFAGQDEVGLAELAENAGTKRAAVEAELSHLRATAPDLAATEAALNRAKSVEDAARQQIDALRPAIATLTERIAGNSGEAVEERLQETDEKLEAALAHRARVEREVKVLQRLQSALEFARTEARDRYFEPVAGELRPLLHLLWPDAELQWADETLLPQALIRHGQPESVDILSGGTQEQIAFLVRLAFARLLAKGGRPAPVILDDALVFTDDDRIERMFDALHRQAGDLQIIVLSCRQRAFRDLGGRVLQIAAV